MDNHIFARAQGFQEEFSGVRLAVSTSDLRALT